MNHARDVVMRLQSMAVAALMAFALAACVKPEPYIPKDLDDCHAQLRAMLPAKEIDRIMAMTNADQMIDYHWGFGVTLRNEWGLWAGSRLGAYFTDLGVPHPDDMSGIILRSFWYRLHDRPYPLEQSIRRYQAHWKAVALPGPDATAPDGATIEFLAMQVGDNPDGTVRAIHTGRSVKDGSFWHYEVDRGVYAPTAEELRALQADEYWKEWATNHPPDAAR